MAEWNQAEKQGSVNKIKRGYDARGIKELPACMLGRKAPCMSPVRQHKYL